MKAQFVDIPDAELMLFTGVFSATESGLLFAELRAGLAWGQDVVFIAGRQALTPRLTAWYGDPGAIYSYSGTRLAPQPWTPALLEIRQRVEALTSACFNSVLANLYRDGRDSVGWHSDDEPELGERPIIASVSFGAVRRFLMRHKKRKNAAPVELCLPNGSVLLMRGDTQRCWRHRIPKTAKPVGPRINLTWRRIVALNPERSRFVL